MMREARLSLDSDRSDEVHDDNMDDHHSQVVPPLKNDRHYVDRINAPVGYLEHCPGISLKFIVSVVCPVGGIRN